MPSRAEYGAGLALYRLGGLRSLAEALLSGWTALRYGRSLFVQDDAKLIDYQFALVVMFARVAVAHNEIQGHC